MSILLTQSSICISMSFLLGLIIVGPNDWQDVRPRYEDYRFEFSLTKDTIITYEPVALRMAATNVSDKPLPRPVFAGMASTGFMKRPYFVSVDGRLPGSGVAVADGFPYPFSDTLWPGEAYVDYHPYAGNMWNRHGEFDTTGQLVLFTGRTWKLIIEVDSDVFQPASRASVPDSVVLYLTVEEPQDQEAKAIALYEEILSHRYASGREERARLAQEFIRRFPQSRIIGQVYAHLGGSAQNWDDLLNRAMNHIRMHPESVLPISWAHQIRTYVGEAAYQDLLLYAVAYAPSSPLLEVEVLRYGRDQ